MRRLLGLIILFAALVCIPSGGAQAQCNGQFGANQVCGSLPGGLPGPVNFSAFPSSSGSVNWINVKSAPCNATGNGSTDDTAAINTCIGTFNAAGSGVLYFPAGTYKTTSALTAITANGVIAGDGQSGLRPTVDNPASVIQSTTTNAALFTINSQALLFRDVTLQNTASSTPVTGSAGILVTSTDVNQKVDYQNIQVGNFFIDIDIQVGTLWSMVNTLLQNPVQYGVRVNNTVNSDSGDWAIVNSFIIAGLLTNGSSTALRIIGSGGGKIGNVKINCGPTCSGGTGQFVNGIDVISNSTVILNVINDSIENFTGTGININGSWPNINIVGVEFGPFAGLATHAITASSTSNLVISDINLANGGNYSGTPISLSSCSQCYVSGVMGINTNALFTGGSKPDHDGSGGLGTYYFTDATSGTNSVLKWTQATGQSGEVNITLDAANTTGQSDFSAINDAGNHTKLLELGSAFASFNLANKGGITGSKGIAIVADDGSVTGGSDDVSIRAGGLSQEGLLVQHNGHVDMTGQNSTAPTLTAGCNGAGSVVTGNDARGTITGQTAAATSCTLSFGTAYSSAPACAITGLSSPLTGAITVGTGSIVVNFASTANYKWSYVCFGT